MDDAAIARTHRVQRHRARRHPRLVGKTPRHLLKRLLTALTIAFDVEHEPQAGVRILTQRDPTHQVLECIQRLAPAADHDAAVRSTHLKLDGRVAVAVADLLHARCLHEVAENGFEYLLSSSRHGIAGSRFPGNGLAARWLRASGLRRQQRWPYRRTNSGPARAEAEQST